MHRIVGLLLLGTACATIGPVDDGTSLSFGTINRGFLLNGSRLPTEGDGYLIPRTWSKRGLNYGTDELVALVVRSSRRVAREVPGGRLYVADLSPEHGGPSAWHRSHQTGRDADLIFFSLDESGNPAAPPAEMWEYYEDGLTGTTDSRNPKKKRKYRLTFDTSRNWALVRALLEDPYVDVQFLFIAESLKQRLLAYAEAQGEPVELIIRAREILHQPGGALPHNDHLHVRIYCPAGDRAIGCADRGPLRWFKKSYKYLEERKALPPALASKVVNRPFCRFLAGSALAFR